MGGVKLFHQTENRLKKEIIIWDHKYHLILSNCHLQRVLHGFHITCYKSRSTWAQQMLTNFWIMMSPDLYQHIALWVEESGHVPRLFDWQEMGSIDAQRSHHPLTVRPFMISLLPTSWLYLFSIPPINFIFWQHQTACGHPNTPTRTHQVQVSVPSNTSMSLFTPQKSHLSPDLHQ